MALNIVDYPTIKAENPPPPGTSPAGGQFDLTHYAVDQRESTTHDGSLVTPRDWPSMKWRIRLDFCLQTLFNYSEHYSRTARLFFRWKRRGPRRCPVSIEMADGIQVHPETPSLINRPSTDICQSEVHDDGDSRARLEAEILDCHAQTGCWPISFTYPKKSVATPDEERTRILSETVPGLPYSYDNEEAYLDAYRRAYYAITHKKGGWDCLRHLEIIYAGAVPIMPDANLIPRFSMIHYPKLTLGRILRMNSLEFRIPSPKSRAFLQTYFNEFLTTEAMARDILLRTGCGPSPSVLFVDELLARSPGGASGYLSVLTLIGLKQVLGDKCMAAAPVPYIYRSWSGSTKTLYGRGFGFTRAVSDNSYAEYSGLLSIRRIAKMIERDEIELVVFGSIMRNTRVFEELRMVLPPERTVLISGEDLPLNEGAREYLSRTDAHVFVRAIEEPLSR